jgi:predicted RNA-binding protein with RPS1 domain
MESFPDTNILADSHCGCSTDTGMALDLPHEGSILQGRIVRIEAYGAFCRLESFGSRRPPQGLIHISQLVPDQRVERVEDVVSIDDSVWVKVLKVEVDPTSQRSKIQLSRKDASQDGMGIDLGKEREAREQQRSQLESNLTSMIGLGVALDPMADRLFMKKNTLGNATFRGGYSLVGDDEGEPEPIVEQATQTRAPIGRGRGTSLPAWMTQQSDGPSGAKGENDSEPEDDTRRKKKKKDHDRKKKKSLNRKSHRKDSSKPDRKKRSRREHGASVSSRSADEEDSRSLASYPERKRIRRKSSRGKDDRRHHVEDGSRRLRPRRTSDDSSVSRGTEHRRSPENKRQRDDSQGHGSIN